MLLEIESRAKNSAHSFTRQFKNGQSLVTSESKDPRSCPGTTITVYDLFHRLPVRRKALNESLELERCRQRMEAFALIHPKISFSLRNDATGQVILQTHKSNSVLGSFTHLFGVGKARNMCEIINSKEQFQIHGYISKEGCSNKSFQFVYINNRLVLKTKIHKYVNFWLGRSKIGNRRGLPKNDGNTKRPPGSPQKQPKKHGIYVINVTCALMEYDITFDPTKTLVEFKAWPVLLSCITEAVQEFLDRENLVNKEERASSSSEDDLSDVEITKPEEKVNKAEEVTDTEQISKSSKYASGISALDIENSLHSKVARRHANHTATDKENLDDILPPPEEKEITEADHTVVPETPKQQIPTPEVDTMDIRASQFNIINTCDIPGNILANAVEGNKPKPLRPNIHHAKVSRDELANNTDPHSTGDVPSSDLVTTGDFQTPYNPIPTLTVSQLLPALTDPPECTPGVRDKTFVSLPKSLTSSEEISLDSQDVSVKLEPETPTIRPAEVSQEPEISKESGTFKESNGMSSIEAFKAAFNQARTQGSRGHAQVTLAPLQRVKERLIAKAQRRKSSQGRKKDEM